MVGRREFVLSDGHDRGASLMFFGPIGDCDYKVWVVCPPPEYCHGCYALNSRFLAALVSFTRFESHSQHRETYMCDFQSPFGHDFQSLGLPNKN